MPSSAPWNRPTRDWFGASSTTRLMKDCNQQRKAQSLSPLAPLRMTMTMTLSLTMMMMLLMMGVTSVLSLRTQAAKLS